MGFSASHAQETIDAIWAKGGLVYVQTLDALHRAGDDISDMLTQITSEAKAKHQADWRKRQP